MSNTDYIINLCHEMQQQGRTPSVALVRSSASIPLSIPEVIKAIQHFKTNPEHRPTPSKDESQKQLATGQSLEQRVNQLEGQLTDILTEITLLKSKIK